MALKRYFLPVAIFAVFVLFCSVFAFWVVFEMRYGTTRTTIAAVIAQAGAFIPLAFVLWIIIRGASTRKRLRSPNYPRIEHLRIAGKYHAVGRYGEMGSSPLNLRG